MASLLVVLALTWVCAGPLGPSRVGATNHLVIIDEVMAGANGNSNIQFVEMRMSDSSQNKWGPQGGESVGRARLVFFDASGTQTGQFVFDSNPPGSSNGSALIATQAFADLSTTPIPDFIIDPLLSTGSGKVCFKDNPSNPFRFGINLCLSYGDFPSGSTEGAGNPAAELPVNGASSLKRMSNLTSFGSQNNAHFELSDAAPKNGSGATGTVPLSATQLAFTVQPSNAVADASISPAVQVEVQNALGATDTSATNSITVAIGTDPSGTATLSGTKTVNAVNGVATFSDLSIDNAGAGFTLAASASGLTGATSDTFAIFITCSPPASNDDWTVVLSCTFQGSDTAQRNVIVESGIALTIDTNASLNINFSSFHLLIKNNAKVVIKSGGKIF